MVLSRIELDLTRHETMKALAFPNLFHGAIEHSFPGARSRKLWRIDTLGGKTYLLVLSMDSPDFTDLAAQFGKSEWETRDYTPLLDRIEADSVWNFRLTANPTISRFVGGSERGRISGHITPEHQKKWLMVRAEKKGFIISYDSFDVVNSRWLRFYKGTGEKAPVTLLSVTYEGILTVKDPDIFRMTLTDGIGRGKAYGLGLMTVIQRR